MLKTILPFYVICFSLYIFFSRQPDYLDGEFTNGVIHYIKDSNQKQMAAVFFIVDASNYQAKASYLFRNLKKNEKVTVIYDTSKPANAAVYKWWGYWLQWDELLASILIPFVFYFGAALITSHPTPKALLDNLEEKRH
jgi:hypothetical protein